MPGGEHDEPAGQPAPLPAVPEHAGVPVWREDQTPPGGWSEPLPEPAGSELADWGSRALATVVDALIWLAATLVLGVPLALAFGIGALSSGDRSLLGTGGATILLVSFALYAAYTGYLMPRPGRRNGQTLGKRLLGIRVQRADGRPVTLGTVAVRHWLMKFVVFGVLSAATLYIATIFNYARPAFGSRRRALHDRVAGTRVVRAR